MQEVTNRAAATTTPRRHASIARFFQSYENHHDCLVATLITGRLWGPVPHAYPVLERLRQISKLCFAQDRDQATTKRDTSWTNPRCSSSQSPNASNLCSSTSATWRTTTLRDDRTSTLVFTDFKGKRPEGFCLGSA